MKFKRLLTIMAIFTLLESILTDELKSIKTLNDSFNQKYIEILFPCKNCIENSFSKSNDTTMKVIQKQSPKKDDSKNFLKDLLQAATHESSKEMQNVIQKDHNKCRVKNIEFSININNCGRVIINSTKCEGYCKSKTTLIPNTNTQKSICYSCKSHEFDRTTYNVKCWDGKFKSITLKTVKACTCFKYSEKNDEIDDFRMKNFL